MTEAFIVFAFFWACCAVLTELDPSAHIPSEQWRIKALHFTGYAFGALAIAQAFILIRHFTTLIGTA